MIVRNIYVERKEPLEMFEDERGKNIRYIL